MGGKQVESGMKLLEILVFGGAVERVTTSSEGCTTHIWETGAPTKCNRNEG